MSDTEMQQLQQQITNLIGQASEILNRGKRDSDGDYAKSAQDMLTQAEQFMMQFNSKARTVFGPQGQAYLKQFQQYRTQVQTLKTQINQIQSQADILESDIHNQTVFQTKQDIIKIQMQSTLQNLDTGIDMGREINTAVIDQNEKMDLLTVKNERINNELKKGQNLAEMIKCTEVKHYYFQTVLVVLSTVLSVTACLCWFILK